MEALFKYRIVFAGLQGFEYQHVELTKEGFILKSITRKEAKSIINSHDLTLSHKCEFGAVYDDGEFKEKIKKSKKLRKTLEILISDERYRWTGKDNK